MKFSSSQILGRDVLAGESFEFFYSLKGVVSRDVFEEFEGLNVSLFEFYLEEERFSPLKFASLNKFEREDSEFLEVSPRLVSVSGANPTEFEVDVDFVNLFKTHADDLRFADKDNLLAVFSEEGVLPGDEFLFEFEDVMSDDMTVYWIEFAVLARVSFGSSVVIDFVEKDDDSGGGSSGGGGRKKRDEFLGEALVVSKFVDDAVVSFGDVLRFEVVVLNPNDFSVGEGVVFDSFPEEFLVVGSSSLRSLVYELGDFLPFETKSVSYELEFGKQVLEDVIYFPAARVEFEKEEVAFSNSLFLVNDLDGGEKKVFMEKIVRILDDNSSAIVKIVVRNVGDLVLEEGFFDFLDVEFFDLAVGFFYF